MKKDVGMNDGYFDADARIRMYMYGLIWIGRSSCVYGILNLLMKMNVYNNLSFATGIHFTISYDECGKLMEGL